MRPVSTFSIVARDEDTNDLGIATASRFLAVGAVVPYAVAGVAAVATQSHANVTYGPRAVRALRADVPLPFIHEAFAATDEEHAQRQYGIVTSEGAALTFTGEGCHPWAGGTTGDGFAAQGNLLTGPEVIDALVSAYEGASGSLTERLLAGLAAADRAGGDARGRQAAALLVVREEGGYGGGNDRLVDLRVDDDPRPVEKLQELFDLHRLLFEAPREEDLLRIEGEVERRLLRALHAHGRLGPDHAAWDERAHAALRDLAGVLNLEGRMVSGRRIDPLVLRHVESG